MSPLPYNFLVPLIKEVYSVFLPLDSGLTYGLLWPTEYNRVVCATSKDSGLTISAYA